jgi:hypothetical protein
MKAIQSAIQADRANRCSWHVRLVAYNELP